MRFLVEVILGLCFSLAITIASAGSTVFKAKSIECVTNPEFVVNSSCNLIAVSWIKSYVNMDCYLLKPLNNVIIQSNFYKKDNTNQFKPFKFSFNISVCGAESKLMRFPYFDVVFDHLRTHTNVNHSCPYTGHMFARQLLSDIHQMPDLPTGVFKLLFQFYEKNYKLGHFQGIVEIFESRKAKKKPNVLKPISSL